MLFLPGLKMLSRGELHAYDELTEYNKPIRQKPDHTELCGTRGIVWHDKPEQNKANSDYI